MSRKISAEKLEIFRGISDTFLFLDLTLQFLLVHFELESHDEINLNFVKIHSQLGMGAPPIIFPIALTSCNTDVVDATIFAVTASCIAIICLLCEMFPYNKNIWSYHYD